MAKNKTEKQIKQPNSSSKKTNTTKTDKKKNYRKVSTKAQKNVKPNTKANHTKNTKNKTSKPKNTLPLKIISLGGLQEIGKNITLYEYGNDILLVDCGMAFPDEEMPGIDIVIPDFSYLVANKDRIKGLVVTHGHEGPYRWYTVFAKKHKRSDLCNKTNPWSY